MAADDSQPSPALRAAHKASAAALLALESAARRRIAAELTKTVRAHLPALRAAPGRHGAAVDIAHKIEAAVAPVVTTARSAARAESRKRFGAELAAVGGDEELLGKPAADSAATDAARGAVTGKSVAAAWLGATLAGLAEGDEDTDPAAVATDALTGLETRLDTTAATEVADAFGSERDDASDAYAAEAARLGLNVPFKVWDATHDKRLCRQCAALDGQIRPFGVDFSGGLVPGSVHPRCRCLTGVWPGPGAVVSRDVELDIGPADAHAPGALRVQRRLAALRDATAWKGRRAASAAVLRSDPADALYPGHAAVIGPLSGHYDDPDAVGGWLGWIEPDDDAWIAFVATDGTALFWPHRAADGGVVGDPTVYSRPDLAASVTSRDGAPMSTIDELLSQLFPPKPTAPMADLTTKKRTALPPAAFALPATRQYPIHDAPRVRNAAARLEQNKRRLKPAQYKLARKNIRAAAKRFNVTLSPVAGEPGFTAAAKADRPQRAGRLQFRISAGPQGEHVIDVRHNAADGADVALAAEYALAVTPIEEPAADAAALADAAVREPPAQWNQIAKVGDFAGHAAGPFRMTPRTFDEIVRNFETVDAKQVPVDFEHASEADATAGSIPVTGAPAQGWIDELQNRGEAGLWGLVRWLPLAREYIRAGNYKALSPAVRFNARHPNTGAPIGARLTSVGLVNRPFLRRMAPLVARDNPTPVPGDTRTMSLGKPIHNPDTMKRLKSAMGLPPHADYADMKTCSAKMRTMADGCAEDLMADLGDGEMFDMKAPLMGMRACMSLGENATGAEIFDAVDAMIKAAIEAHEAEYHMSDTNTDGATLVKLGELGAKLDERTVKLRDTENRLAGESLKLKDEAAKREAAEAKAAELEATLVSMRDAETKRAEAELVTLVGNRFDAYKDVKKLGEADKSAMRLVAMSDRKLFDELYPPVAPNQVHLQRDLTGSRQPIVGPTTRAGVVRMGGAAGPIGGPTTRMGGNAANAQTSITSPAAGLGGGDGGTPFDQKATQARLMKDNGMSEDDAYLASIKLARAAAANRTAV